MSCSFVQVVFLVCFQCVLQSMGYSVSFVQHFFRLNRFVSFEIHSKVGLHANTSGMVRPLEGSGRARVLDPFFCVRKRSVHLGGLPHRGDAQRGPKVRLLCGHPGFNKLSGMFVHAPTHVE